MRNYIRADLKRILGRPSHIFSMLLLFAIYAGLLYMGAHGVQVTSVSFITSACSNAATIAVFIGLFEMIGIFSEDFKVKTMQIAIGMGVSRNKVVLCKLFEVFTMLVVDAILMVGVTLGMGAVVGVSIPMAVLMDLIKMLLVQLIFSGVIFTSLTMIVLFTTQSTVLSIFVYVLVSVDIGSLLIELPSLMGVSWFESLRLNRFTISRLIGLFDTRLALGTFDVPSFLGALAYLVVGVVATCKLFQKRELDF